MSFTWACVVSTRLHFFFLIHFIDYASLHIYFGNSSTLFCCSQKCLCWVKLRNNNRMNTQWKMQINVYLIFLRILITLGTNDTLCVSFSASIMINIMYVLFVCYAVCDIWQTFCIWKYWQHIEISIQLWINKFPLSK